MDDNDKEISDIIDQEHPVVFQYSDKKISDIINHIRPLVFYQFPLEVRAKICYEVSKTNKEWYVNSNGFFILLS